MLWWAVGEVMMASETASGDAQDDSTGAQASQVRIILSTTSEDVSLPNNPGPILVNTNFRRYALSTLVNTLLQSEKTIPFEFLINGQFLRTSLDEYLTENGISAETTLPVEYVRAIIPPSYLASFKHDDWVSSVDVFSLNLPGSQALPDDSHATGRREKILSGSYDGKLRIWNTSAELLSTSPGPEKGGHLSSIKAVRFVSQQQVASAGLDRTIKLWKLSMDEDEMSASLTPRLELYGHRSSIDSIDIHEPSKRILSASTDHSIGVWSLQKSDAPAAAPNLLPSLKGRGTKRQKVGPATTIPQRGPLSILESHTAAVSSAIFDPNDHTVAYSSSWDHTLKTWDLPTATCVDTRTTSHSLLSLTSLRSLNLLAAGTSARHITLIDPRVAVTTVAAMTLRGHINAVVSLASHPVGPYGLVSGSHDGMCRVWDVRSSKSDKDGRTGESTYCIERESAKGGKRRTAGEGVKVFGVCWDRNVGIVSAGEDKRVQINSGAS